MSTITNTTTKDCGFDAEVIDARLKWLEENPRMKFDPETELRLEEALKDYRQTFDKSR